MRSPDMAKLLATGETAPLIDVISFKIDGDDIRFIAKDLSFLRAKICFRNLQRIYADERNKPWWMPKLAPFAVWSNGI